MLVAALAALALGVAAQPAAAKTPCWQQIINEWHDNNGRVSANYPLHCYREAIAHVPEDLRVYTGIVEEILSARQQASRRKRAASDGRKRRPDHSRRRQAAGVEGRSGGPSPAVFKQGLDKLGSRNVDTVPLPLLIMAGLALLLIAAGGAGLVSRRLRARKAPG